MPDDSWRAIFPTLSVDELGLAAERLDQYLTLAWEIMLEANLDAFQIPGQDSNAVKVQHKA